MTPSRNCTRPRWTAWGTGWESVISFIQESISHLNNWLSLVKLMSVAEQNKSLLVEMMSFVIIYDCLLDAVGFPNRTDNFQFLIIIKVWAWHCNFFRWVECVPHLIHTSCFLHIFLPNFISLGFQEGICRSVCLSVCLSLCLCVCVCVCLSIFVVHMLMFGICFFTEALGASVSCRSFGNLLFTFNLKVSGGVPTTDTRDACTKEKFKWKRLEYKGNRRCKRQKTRATSEVLPESTG